MGVDGKRPEPDAMGRVGDIGGVTSVCNIEVKRAFACSSEPHMNQWHNGQKNKKKRLTLERIRLGRYNPVLVGR